MTTSENSYSAGILLVNLGTPDSPSTKDVKHYLREFLWDPRVVEMPRPLWWLILNGVILNIRPAHSAKAYQKIWEEEGSPLLVYTLKQAAALQQILGQDIKVTPAMRYGNPSIKQGLEQLRDQGCQRILVFPLYPQYSATTTASVFDAVATELKHWRLIPELRFLNQYFDDSGFVQALAASVQTFQQQHGQPDKLIISYHGLPQRYADAGDPYPCQCEETTKALVNTLNLTDEQWAMSYQSRMGREPWLQPATADSLRELAASGCRHVQVICPGFSADCLETLEEIAMENREVFLAAGGERYEYIPCLNDAEQHIQALANLAKRQLGGWANE
ncbi:MAG TPA: ferrochelatase [Thiolapillus brandeum]|uniref:Ferrochelatase n=1 Tax=Thiolapillus brandeum TaxID=1076588 RepID=A0A831KDA6_9GAMM|nr:ferrochelatase [Thiolapillus brandeum]